MKFSYTEKDIFKDYEGVHDYSTLKAIWAEVGAVATDELLKGKKLLAPRVGYFQIRKYKARKPLVDYKLTKQTGRTIRYNNRHTGGMAVKFMWFRTYEGATLQWAFKPVRTTRRLKMAPYIRKHGVHHFYEIT